MGIQKSYFLEIFPYFRKARSELVENILAVSRYETASRHQILKKEGTELTEFIFLLSGEKRIYKASKTGREITLYEMGPGDICVLNASCLLSKSKLPANAESITDVGMLVMSSSDFHDLLARYEEMRSFVFSRISKSLISIMSLISEISFRRMDERLSDYLIEKSDNHQVRTTHIKIANDLGTSREVVSRLLKEFERQGMVNLSRNIIELRSYPPNKECS